VKGRHQQVLLLGTRTGWSYREIITLPRSVFDLYVKTLTNTDDASDDDT
jgi:hypothetical protein